MPPPPVSASNVPRVDNSIVSPDSWQTDNSVYWPPATPSHNVSSEIARSSTVSMPAVSNISSVVPATRDIIERQPHTASGYDWVEHSPLANDGFAALADSPEGKGYFGKLILNQLMTRLRIWFDSSEDTASLFWD